jgi:hypothetical protein
MEELNDNSVHRTVVLEGMAMCRQVAGSPGLYSECPWLEYGHWYSALKMSRTSFYITFIHSFTALIVQDGPLTSIFGVY